MIVTFICTTGLLITRCLYLGHLLLSNLYESFMFLSSSSSVLHIVLEVRNRDDRWLGAITAPSTMLNHGFATLVLPEEMQLSRMLVPALQSHWSMLHVSMILFSYATLLCGSLTSIALLVIMSIVNRQVLFGVMDNFFSRSILPNEKFYSHEKQKSDLQYTFDFSSMNYRKCQLIKQLDHWSYRAIGLDFSLSTKGTLSGAIWANETWGSYWNWDPKETWALITWTIFTIYLHTRMNKGW
jgi:cytochrome c-type biogenesis protein CcsB